jgi:hypothetical protein
MAHGGYDLELGTQESLDLRTFGRGFYNDQFHSVSGLVKIGLINFL